MFFERLSQTNMDAAIQGYEQMWPIHDRYSGTIATNLGVWYMRKQQQAMVAKNKDEEAAWRLKAAQILHEGVERAPSHSVLRNTRGVFLMGQQMWKDALVEFDYSVHLNKKSPFVYRNRGSCYVALGDFERAQAEYEKAYQMDGRMQPQRRTTLDLEKRAKV